MYIVYLVKPKLSIVYFVMPKYFLRVDIMYKTFEKLCELKGITPYRFGKDTGVNSSTLSTWKKKNSMADPKTSQKVCEYFGVSMDFLMGKTDKIVCEECGTEYNPFDDFDCAIHENVHKTIEAAEKLNIDLVPYKDIIKKRVDYKIKLEDGTFDFENDLTDYLEVRYSDYIYNNVGSTNLIDRMGYYKKCLVEIINKGFVPENNINTFVESFGLNRDYIDMNGAFIARISKNYDVMKLAKIAEKLPPEMLNMLLFQAEAFYDKYTKG